MRYTDTMNETKTRVRNAAGMWTCKACGSASNAHFHVRRGTGENGFAILVPCPNDSREPANYVQTLMGGAR